MAKKRDPLGNAANWHVDCRLVTELPEESVVGTRFLVNAPFALLALGTLLIASWLAYRDFSLRYQVSDWEHRILDTREEMKDIEHMQVQYSAEGAKIDAAYSIIKTPVVYSAFIGKIGKTLPNRVVVNSFDATEDGIVIKGNIRETSEHASIIMGGYVKQLKTDPDLTPYFKSISLTGLERQGEGDMLSFEITFRFIGRQQ